MKFIKNYPALFIEEKKILVIADFHIGLEYELAKSGINIPSQTKRMKKDMDYLLNSTKASTLVILGDVKHKVPGMSWQEIRDIPDLLEYISSKVKVVICKGNHDDQIEKIVPEKIQIHGATGLKIGKYGFFHGHTWPDKKLLSCDYIISGHTHPTIQFIDSFGYRIVEPVWVKGKINKKMIQKKFKVKNTGNLNFIIIPAFNNLLGGTQMNKNTKPSNNELIGPLLRNNFVDVDDCELYLLDGIYLGVVKDLKVKTGSSLQV